MDYAQRIIDFANWKICLAEDAYQQGKREVFNLIPEYILRLWFHDGLAPTVRAVSPVPNDQSEFVG